MVAGMIHHLDYIGLHKFYCIFYSFSTVDLGFEYYPYIGSYQGEYIPELCFQVGLTDPAKYYVQGWEGIIGTTATFYHNDIRLTINSSEIYFSEVITLQLTNATHRKTCFKIEYSDIANFIHGGGNVIYVSVHDPFGIPTEIEDAIVIPDTCKFIVIV